MSVRALQILSALEDASPIVAAEAAIEPAAGLLLDWPQWLALRAHWPEGLPVGVAFPNDLPVDALVPELPRLAVVGLRFPKWTDGRAYSQARLLRTRHRFGGELRAIGDVIPDMAAQLHRTGFDAAVLRTGESVEVAHRMLGLIPVFYQADAHQGLAHYARLAPPVLPT
ncbi:MAG: DUF934 domain-containing protein [Caldimonas sp.]